MATASSSSSFSSGSREARQIQPLNIDFAKKEEEIRGTAFTSKKIRLYAEKALIEIKQLQSQMVPEIGEYNLNSSFKEAICGKIDSVLAIVHSSGFPKSSNGLQLRSLEVFLPDSNRM